MLTETEARKAVEEGVKRAGCELVCCEFTDINLRIEVKKPGEHTLMIGEEPNWSRESADQLSLRVRRFALFYCQKINYHSVNPFGSIQGKATLS